ncbi:hypothetical protein C8R46DRAFT_1192607 [Mycena filopes]|nr:hypothetical protein C8R46DRAFT_1192607 [Mycena filopes]
MEASAKKRPSALQIQSLTADLKALQTKWQQLTSRTGGDVPPPPDHSNDPAPPIVLPPETTSGGSRWQSIFLTSDAKSRASLGLDASSAEHKQWSCNFWIASGGGSSDKSSATVTSSTADSEDTIDLAFRATLVTVDRGGWFQPQFFKESKAFYKVNNDISWVDNKTGGVNGLMPGFPVAFLLVKDVIVRVTHSASAGSDSKTVDKTASQSSGGFLCFSYSQNSQSSTTKTANSFQSYSNGYIIKIPGPQILGYMMEKTDTDDAQPMPAEFNKDKDFFIPDDEYNKTVNGNQPGHTVVGAPAQDPAHPEEPKPVSPAVTQEQMQEVLAKMVKEKIAELFGTMTAPASS